ncbi:hypothetical protein [cf. Phormidesmis sp. LEGE 11477]|uniref:hypothetical protein n=1 Tax=cf. Phormidesmis sp. LEGE 11477 TaxID=1828680 RepID=UPI00187E9AB5|nr:hypothetical protein [cf. Phormidesmis sp. LEGE 11477]MBE9063399.1 hypothetical protein [cf. Phormidesmis sp. LEGE 11477]
MSISVLPQLLEVDSELSAQASVLEAKLGELQQKRQGIQAVISMFESGDVPAAADISAIANAPTTTKTATKKTTAGTKTTGKRKVSKSATKSTATKASATKSTSSKATKTKTTRGRPAQVKKAPASAKRSGKTADWQRYIQTTYKKSPLPDVIVGVLQSQPNSVFKIVDVMNLVFKEDMPKSQFLKARNRISNILSAGARDGVWHRGGNGTYSMSEKAIKAG